MSFIMYMFYIITFWKCKNFWFIFKLIFNPLGCRFSKDSGPDLVERASPHSFHTGLHCPALTHLPPVWSTGPQASVCHNWVRWVAHTNTRKISANGKIQPSLFLSAIEYPHHFNTEVSRFWSGETANCYGDIVGTWNWLEGHVKTMSLPLVLQSVAWS